MRRARVAGASMVALALAGLGAGANSPPRADVLVLEVLSNVPTPVVLSATDPDGDNLTFSVVGGPHHGRLEGVPPKLTYTSNPGFRGSDEITFLAADPLGAFDLGLVRLHVTAALTTIRLGQPEDVAEPTGDLSAVATHLVRLQVGVWYILTHSARSFAIGDEIAVLLPPQSTVTWVGLVPLGPKGAEFVSISWNWNPTGWLHVRTYAAPPGSYVLTAVVGHEAFSFLLTLHSTPGQGLHLATSSSGEREGGLR